MTDTVPPEAGKYYMIRDRRIIGPLYRDRRFNHVFTFMGILWRDDGTSMRVETEDLIHEIEPPKIVERRVPVVEHFWINLGRAAGMIFGEVFPARETADRNTQRSRIAVLHLTITDGKLTGWEKEDA